MGLLKSLILILLLLVAVDSSAHEVKCEIELKPRGVWSRYCPAGTLMDANATRVNLSGGPRPIVFVYDDVRCVEPVIKCQKVEEEVDSIDQTE